MQLRLKKLSNTNTHSFTQTYYNEHVQNVSVVQHHHVLTLYAVHTTPKRNSLTLIMHNTFPQLL